MSGTASGELTVVWWRITFSSASIRLIMREHPLRRKKAVQRPKAWALLPNEWRALALLAASKASVDAPSIEPEQMRVVAE